VPAFGCPEDCRDGKEPDIIGHVLGASHQKERRRAAHPISNTDSFTHTISPAISAMRAQDNRLHHANLGLPAPGRQQFTSRDSHPGLETLAYPGANRRKDATASS
jgi:hypothetical protein